MARAAPATIRASGATRRPPARTRGIRWDRVGRLALLVVLVAVVGLYIAPAKQWFEQRDTAAAHSRQLSDLEAEHERLARRASALRNPNALEREARKLGMVRRGERSFVIENPPR